MISARRRCHGSDRGTQLGFVGVPRSPRRVGGQFHEPTRPQGLRLRRRILGRRSTSPTGRSPHAPHGPGPPLLYFKGGFLSPSDPAFKGLPLPPIGLSFWRTPSPPSCLLKAPPPSSAGFASCLLPSDSLPKSRNQIPTGFSSRGTAFQGSTLCLPWSRPQAPWTVSNQDFFKLRPSLPKVRSS